MSDLKCPWTVSAKSNPREAQRGNRNVDAQVMIRPINQQPLQQLKTKQTQNKNTEMQIFDKQYTTWKNKNKLKPTAINFSEYKAAENE